MKITNKDKDWSFSNIPEGFDAHVKAQLPFYDELIKNIAFIIRNYISENGTIYDIGSSTNNIKKLLKETIIQRNLNYISIDNNKDMKADFYCDAVEFNYMPCEVVILNLTMMFIPVKHRKDFLNKLKSNLSKGGIIILVDKFVQPYGYLSTVLKRNTLWWKYNNGVPAKNIIEKEISLSGVQIPLMVEDYENDMKRFFQMGEFMGFIFEK